MFFILSKVLSFLFAPLSWAFLLIIAGFFWKKRGRKLRIVAFVVLYLFSNSFLLQEVTRWWQVPITLDQDLQPERTGVVLGGFSVYDTTAERISFGCSADRIMQGLRLLGTGKIQTLVVSGGSGYVLKPEMKESVFVGQYLREINVPEDRFLLETTSRNTQENAVNTAALLQAHQLDRQPIVLITSAYHMRRAKGCFEKQGLTVIPYATDATGSERSFSFDTLLLPDAQALIGWDILIHEWIGYISYWVMGYV